MTPSEQVIYDQLVKEGCTVYNSGWPDFLVVAPDGTLRCIEVKGKGDFVRKNQHTMHEILRSLGLKVEVVQFGTPGRTPVHGRYGKCPFCGDVVKVRVCGTPYQHAGYNHDDSHNEEDDRMLCPEEPDDRWANGKTEEDYPRVTEFVERKF